MHILVIDDNHTLQFGLKKLLEESNYIIYTALSIKEAQELLAERTYDLILLDWMLPDGSGVEFLKQIRQDGLAIPIMLFSSKNEVVDKVEALDAGADDYLEKPFSNIELLARIRALLRRESPQKQSIITIGPMKIDTIERRVTVDENPIKLSTKEFELLEFLARNSNVVLTRYQLLEHINRDFETMASSNIVDAHIKNLRKKLGKPELIETVRGVGYVIRTT
ncbi:response regulator transcription factor [Hydrogenimonas thermophila]|uniref:DNA-binding response regulator, OmpR family, contains REC and winged-helix (WHTH) domain n=1 Tax=Hydrogenimonas thermophila TaxID=223786 RepID=A0A1I5MNR3_9BACT|nr:response regulator transcription factor [Hydrogenimonas thermophila]SFP11254.1 DNA-binding response regulator, OmpR family, contains REC and winged-helix (wHTH) domain [Hydrogenimonas thermophila]